MPADQHVHFPPPFAGAPPADADELVTAAGLRRMIDRIVAAIAATGDAVAATNRAVDSTAAEVHRVSDEQAELRDELLAIANRLESLTRAFHSRTDHLV